MKQTVVAVNPVTNAVVTSEEEVIPKLADQFKAWAKLGDIGMGENVSTEDVRARLQTTIRIITECAPHDVAERIIDRMQKVWRS